MVEKTQGRKRHIVVDVMGNLFVSVVHAANIYDANLLFLWQKNGRVDQITMS